MGHPSFARWNVDLAGDGVANRIESPSCLASPAAPAIPCKRRPSPFIPRTSSACFRSSSPSGDTAAARAAVLASVIPLPGALFPASPAPSCATINPITLVAQVPDAPSAGGSTTSLASSPMAPRRHPGSSICRAPRVPPRAWSWMRELLPIRCCASAGRGSDGVVDGFAIKANGVAKITPYSSIYTVFDKTAANHIEAVSPWVTHAATTRYRLSDRDAGAAANPISVTLPAADNCRARSPPTSTPNTR